MMVFTMMNCVGWDLQRRSVNEDRQLPLQMLYCLINQDFLPAALASKSGLSTGRVNKRFVPFFIEQQSIGTGSSSRRRRILSESEARHEPCK